MRWVWSRLALGFVVLAIGCAPTAPTAGPAGEQSQERASPAPRTVNVGINEDPKNFWDAINGGGGSGARQLGHLVNQYLVALGSDAEPRPRLLADIPSVENGLWRILADGTMETTYKLRPEVRWHDGAPFTAEDLVFSWEVGRDPDIPNSNQTAVRLIREMRVEDPTTAVAVWRNLYPFADRLEHREFYPLPKHILERPYRESKDQLIAQPFFSSEFVGTGPYRVVRWEPGSHLELTAFDQYFLGRPKLDAVRVHFISDDNTALANLRAGTLHTFLPTGGPTFEQYMILKREWDSSRAGTMLTESVRWLFGDVQKFSNPQPRDLTDARVRRALLHGLNRQEITSALVGELGIVADSWVHPDFSYYPRVRDAIVRYDYDPRRAAALFEEAGWSKVGETLQKGTERFTMTIRYRDEEKEATIAREHWKAVGVSGELEFLSETLLRDRQARASFTGVDISSNPMGGLSAVRRFISEAIPTEADRWAGTNRGGFSDPAWDEIGQRMRVELSSDRRIELERDLVRIFVAQLPALPLYYEIQPVPVAGGLTGLQPTRAIAHTGHVQHTWNVHEWDIERR